MLIDANYWKSFVHARLIADAIQRRGLVSQRIATRIPGDSYDVARGCSIINWPREAEACIVFEGYPEATE